MCLAVDKRKMEKDSIIVDSVEDLNELETVGEDFSGGYIEASQEAYDLLIASGHIFIGEEYGEIYKTGYYVVIENKEVESGLCDDGSNETINSCEYDFSNLKQLYINQGKLSWEKPEDTSIGNNPNIDKYSDPHAELKERYATGEYDGYHLFCGQMWGSIPIEQFNMYSGDIVLIKKEHSPIAQAVIENPDVEVEYTHKLIGSSELGVYKVEDFFNHYQEHFNYRLKPIQEEPIDSEKLESGLNRMARFTKEKETISIEDKKEHFAKFGFEVPDFECELLKAVPTARNSKHLICVGYMIDKDDETHTIAWDVPSGKAFVYNQWIKDFNLTPISKPWYENEKNFPCLMSDTLGHHRVAICRDMFLMNEEDGFRLATKEERDSLHVVE